MNRARIFHAVFNRQAASNLARSSSTFAEFSKKEQRRVSQVLKDMGSDYEELNEIVRELLQSQRRKAVT